MPRGSFSACLRVSAAISVAMIGCGEPAAKVKMVPTTLVRLGGLETALLEEDHALEGERALERPGPIVDEGDVYGPRARGVAKISPNPPADPVARVWWFLRVPHWLPKLVDEAVGAPPQTEASGAHIARAVNRMRAHGGDFGRQRRKIEARTQALLKLDPSAPAEGAADLASGFDGHRFLWPALQARNVSFARHPQIEAFRARGGSLAAVIRNLALLLEAEALDALLAGDVTQCTRWLVRQARFASHAAREAVTVDERALAVRIARTGMRLFAWVAARHPAAVDIPRETWEDLEQRIGRLGNWIGHARRMLRDPDQMDLWEAVALADLGPLWRYEALEAFERLGRDDGLSPDVQAEVKRRLEKIVMEAKDEGVVLRAREILDLVALEPALDLAPATGDAASPAATEEGMPEPAQEVPSRDG